jgi:D-tyrosyl-tRNA(Tyr) deacylase
MRALIQRVSSAKVIVESKVTGAIESGLLVLLGVEDADTSEDLNWLIQKIIKMRIFSDSEGKMNLSVSDVDGGILVVSQFTLHAGTKKGNRPSFIKAGKPDFAKEMYEQFIAVLQAESGLKIEAGIFGADMKVSLTNDGPVTIWMDTKNKE